MGDATDFEGCISYGPWGGSYGDTWDYRPESYITKISVYSDQAIKPIEFGSSSSKGETQSRVFGRPVKSRSPHVICIDYPDEYLVSISGTHGVFSIYVDVVRSICFKTNQKLYGPYGCNVGTGFSYDVKDGKIIGFHGRADSYLNAIGVYVKPNLIASIPNPPYKDKINHESSSCIFSGMLMPREVGPWGAGDGAPWDDGVFSTIKQVRVHLRELNVICALQFEYLKSDGKSVLSQIHGGTSECKIEIVNLHVKDEFLIGISGFYGPVEGNDGLEAIVSITFHSNVRVYGPYGRKKSAGYVYFRSPSSPGKVLGFQGRDNGFLGAIGVHMEYF